MVPKFVNNRPLIGVAAMEVMGIKLLAEVEGSRGKDYFGASFVKLIESAGGRAVPVLEVSVHPINICTNSSSETIKRPLIMI